VSETEFSRNVKVRPLPGDPLKVEANEAERSALAERFGLSAIDALHAEVALDEEKQAIRATGTFSASLLQACAVSGEDFPVAINEPLDLRFVRQSTLQATRTDEGEIEINLNSDEGDEIEFSGDTFDLGEAIAQTLGLAIDPYAEGPNAEAARAEAGISGDDAPSGPLAEALAALKKD